MHAKTQNQRVLSKGSVPSADNTRRAIVKKLGEQVKSIQKDKRMSAPLTTEEKMFLQSK